MKREEIYNHINSAFHSKYSWLGEQFSKEFLLSCASWNIQRVSQPDFRVRRHLMLFWDAGYLKSSLLLKGYKLLGEDLCTKMSDVSMAALRGTIEGNRFVSPFTLKRPFSVCTEFGQLSKGSGSTELTQKLLNILEEGQITVSLGKVGLLPQRERERIEYEFPVKFIDRNTFTYSTDWILMAGTYDRTFLKDEALASRFNLVVPDRPFDSGLTRHVLNSPEFELEETVIDRFREELVGTEKIETKVKLPEEIYTDKSLRLTMRGIGMVVSNVLCRRWWGIGTSNEEMIEMANEIKKKQILLWTEG